MLGAAIVFLILLSIETSDSWLLGPYQAKILALTTSNSFKTCIIPSRCSYHRHASNSDDERPAAAAGPPSPSATSSTPSPSLSRTKEGRKRDNIDLFAVGERPNREKLSSTTTSSSSSTVGPPAAPPSVQSAPPTNPSPATLPIPSSSSGREFERSSPTDPTALRSKKDIPFVEPTSTVEKGGFLATQAELLRLEAEKDSIIVEQDRLEERKELLRAIDKSLLYLLQSLPASSASSYGSATKSFVVNHKGQLKKELFLRIIELANNEHLTAEKDRLYKLYEDLLQDLSELDSNQYTEVIADIQKEINQELFSSATNTAAAPAGNGNIGGKRLASSDGEVKSYDQVLQSWLQQLQNETLVQSNTSNLAINFSNYSSLNNMIDSRIFRLPSALPLEFVGSLMKSPALTDREVEQLKNEVFAKEFFEDLYSSDASPVISVFRGVPKTSYHDTLLKLQERLRSFPSLQQKVQIVLYPEYKSPNPNGQSEDAIATAGKRNPSRFTSGDPNSSNNKNVGKVTRKEKYGVSNFEPVFLVFSSEVQPVERSNFESIGSVLSIVAALFTSFTYAIGVYAFNQDFFNKAMQGDSSILPQLIPVTFGVMFLQLIHDFAHIVVAQSRNVKLGYPSIYVPSPQIGIYGSVTRFLSFVKNRKDLFDISIAGPLTGFIASFASTIIGLLLTVTSSSASSASFPTLPVSFFQSSSLFYSLVDQYLHVSLSLDPSQAASALVAVHPLVLIGYAGLISNALNFLPIGKLDGGRVLMSIVGRRTTSLLTVLFLFLQGILLIFFSSASTNVIVPFWLITVAFLQRNVELPPIDDVTPITSLPSSSSLNSNAPSQPDLAYWLRLASIALCVVFAVGFLLPSSSISVSGVGPTFPPLPPFPPLDGTGGVV